MRKRILNTILGLLAIFFTLSIPVLAKKIENSPQVFSTIADKEIKSNEKHGEIMKNFLNRNNINRVNKSLNDNIDPWNGKNIQVKLESYEPIHGVGHGRNGASTMVELITRLYDINSINLVAEGDSTNRYLSVYFDARGTEGQRCSNRQTYLSVKIGNKIQTVNTPERLVKLLGDDIPGFYGKPLDNAKYLLKPHNERDLKKVLNERNIKVYQLFTYTHRHWFFRPNFIKNTKKAIKIGWMSRNTYNSLPVMLDIKMVKEVKKVSLSELGVEKPGYYSHHDRMSIRPEQKEQALLHLARFKRLSEGS